MLRRITTRLGRYHVDRYSVLVHRFYTTPSSVPSLQRQSFAIAPGSLGMHKFSGSRNFSSLPPHEVVGLPALSPTMETGTIISWKKSEGDEISAGDVICEVETDKATVDFEAQDDGYLAKILQPEKGSEVAVGVPIMVIVTDQSSISAFGNFAPDSAGGTVDAPAPEAETNEARLPEAPTPQPVAAAGSPNAAPAPSGGRVFASPLARKLAKEQGIDISRVPPTGPNGRVLAADVRDYTPSAADIAAVTTAAAAAAPVGGSAGAAAPSASAPSAGAGYFPFSPAVTSGEFVDIPAGASAQALTDRLAQSKREVPHYYLTVDVEVDKLLGLRSELLGLSDPKKDDGSAKITLNDMIVKASAAATKQVPDVNGYWMDSFVRNFKGVDINVYVSTPEDGTLPLLVPGCESRGLQSIAEETKRLEMAAQDGTLSGQDVAMGTFSVVNVGMFGVKSMAPIVPTPQACVLSVGEVATKVVPNPAYKGGSEEAPMYKYVKSATVTLSCDHRVVDGAVGAQWLQAFKKVVENPSMLVL